nr:reverse transcriptase domain-containing protein [Tanacetum cinerariifolium]
MVVSSRVYKEIFLNGFVSNGSDVEEVEEKEIVLAKKEYAINVFMLDINNGVYGSDEFRRYDLIKFNYSCVPFLEFCKGSCVQGDLCEYPQGVLSHGLGVKCLREDIRIRNTYLRDMLLEISQVDFNAVGDHCVWTTAKDGIFFIGESHRIIDYGISWLRALIFLRFRVHHATIMWNPLLIFFYCNFAKEVWKLLHNWFDIYILSFSSFELWKACWQESDEETNEMQDDLYNFAMMKGRPFLHTVDVVIRVKQKQLNLGVGTERITFSIISTMKHSYSNDDTCFSINIIDEILKEDFDALLDERKTKEPPFEKITFNIDYKIKTSLEEPPSDLELKPLPDNLEYVILEEPSFLPVIISSQLSEKNKNKLISIFERHKQAFAWKITNIPGICPSFCKHKIQHLEDKKPVVKKQRRLNQNMQEVVKKEIVKLLDTDIIYSIVDSPLIMLLQEFDIEIKDEKVKNVAADHLSRIDNDKTSDDSDVDDNFAGETLMEITTNDTQWFADFANYLVGDIMPKGMTYQ